MEDKENDEIIPTNDEAPPVPFISSQINNNLNNMLPNNNINNINLNDSNFNLISNDLQSKENINENKNQKMNNDNKNIISKNPSLNININNRYNFQPPLLKNQMYPGYNMMYFNYFNQPQKNNINNLYVPYIPYNNKNNNTVNKQQIKDNSNLHDLKIDIDSNTLNILGKEYLKDIILFIHDFCQIKIDPKFTHLKHNMFKIKKDKSNDIGHLFIIKKNKIFKYNNKDNQDNSDSIDDDITEKINIINENIPNNIKLNENHKDNILSNFYCEIHDKVFLNTDKNLHYKSHLKCDKCGLEIKNNRALKVHYRVQHQEFIQKISDNNKINNSENKEPPKQNFNLNEEKIKCSDCDLIFNSVELMSEHFYNIHEKNKSQNIINKQEGINEEEINKKKEQQKKKEKNLEELKEQKEEKEYYNKRQKYLQKNSKEQKLELYYYECYLDKQKFDNEKEYAEHFFKFHKGDFPFYCDICKKGFWSYKAIDGHSRAKGHYK